MSNKSIILDGDCFTVFTCFYSSRLLVDTVTPYIVLNLNPAHTTKWGGMGVGYE